MSSVVICPYSSEWPGMFQALREELLAAFTPIAVTVEHIGSTAVPGLAAKPVLDLLLGAASLADIEAHIRPLEALGYTYIQKYERELPTRRYFVKSPEASLRVHLHGVVTGSHLWRDQLAFRDMLRADAGLRASYQALKLQLAEAFGDDKAAYTAAKGPFIQAALRTPTSD